MSRCFPFPPPGYTKNSDALIESIKFGNVKLQSEGKKAKKDRKKEKRREKKDKESKKEKKKDRKEKEGKELKLIELKKIGSVQKGAYHENEQLERSDITVEHSQPVTTPDPCCSDSTQSSNKRKFSTSPSMHNNAKKLRFSLRKHAESGDSKLEDQLVSTSRSIGTYGDDDLLPQVMNADRDQCPGNYESKYYDELKSLPVGAALNTNLLDDEGMRMVSKYNSLFQNWVPLLPACDGFRSEEDQDWLFSSKQQEERTVSKPVKAVTSALNCSSTSLWPRAQYLPEVELYALPYAIPF